MIRTDGLVHRVVEADTEAARCQPGERVPAHLANKVPQGPLLWRGQLVNRADMLARDHDRVAIPDRAGSASATAICSPAAAVNQILVLALSGPAQVRQRPGMRLPHAGQQPSAVLESRMTQQLRRSINRVRTRRRTASVWEALPCRYDFLNNRSKASRASSGLRGAGWELAPVGARAELPLLVPSRATVTRGVNRPQSLALSLTAMRAGIGLRHWKRVDGSKCEHCLQQCSSALHLGQLELKSMSGGRAVEQLKQREAATC